MKRKSQLQNVLRFVKNVFKVISWKLEQRLLYRYISKNQIKKLSKSYYETKYKQIDWLKIQEDYRNYVLDHVKKRGGAYDSILDVGTGDGKAIATLNFKVKVGLDISKKLLKKASERNQNIHVVLGDAEHLPFIKKVFDVVILLDIIEHVLEVESIFNEAKRVARSELILTTDYRGILSPCPRIQFIDKVPKLKLLTRWGELTFFEKGKPVPFWKGLLFAHGLMIRTILKKYE
jgi:RNase P protein component